MRVIPCLCIAMFMATTAYSATYHVEPGGGGDATTIQAGLALAAAGDTVVVACGTYYEHDIQMKSGVCLRSETDPADCVTIDAALQGRIFHCDGTGSGTRIEGLLLTGGGLVDDLVSGAGILCDGQDPTLTLRECVFYGFASRSVVFCHDGATVSISHSAFVDNQSADHLIKATFTDLTMSYCVLAWNRATDIVGLDGGLHPTLISDCTFAHNTLTTGDAVIHYPSMLPFELTISNTIIAFTTGGSAVEGMTSTLAFTCCDVYGNENGDYAGSLAGLQGIDGNISADPLFCDPFSLDFSISEHSMCAPTHSSCGRIGGYDPACDITGVEEPPATAPLAFRVDPAVPNPFNPATEITYQIPAAARVTVVVLDARGRVVRTLWDVEQAPGTYTVRWDGTCEDGTPAASGTYLCRLAWNGRTESRRLLLLK